MLPLYPPGPFLDLAKEHLGGHQRHTRRHHHDELDGISTKLSERQPDPVYVSLRWLVASRPIVALLARIDRRIEVRKDGMSDTRTHPIVGGLYSD